MSDHGSGPRAFADPVLDITDVYAFPAPERAGHFVLAMMVFPIAMPSALFSDAVDYRFRLRPVRPVTNGAGPTFAAGEEERVVSVTFDPPQAREGHDALGQTGTCTLPSGEVIAFRVGDEAGGEGGGVRVFAGCRLDPFFIDLSAMGRILQTRQVPVELSLQNTLEGQNVLSIIVEGDSDALFGKGEGPLFAAVAETTTMGSLRIRLERVGRPEIKNFILNNRAYDPVNRDLEIRDLYNAEDTFAILPDYLDAYRARLSSSLASFDGLDGETDWPLDAHGQHPLTDLLLADFLVVDVSKPFDEDGYLEIERAVVNGGAHTTCGGRSFNHDIVDSFLTLLVNNGNGPQITDGADRPTAPASSAFPYLHAPNSKPPARPAFFGPAA